MTQRNQLMVKRQLMIMTGHLFIRHSNEPPQNRHRGHLKTDSAFTKAPRLDIHSSLLMLIPAAIQCPYCGQSFELMIDSSTPSQSFTTDCEICCRPFEVSVECEAGEILSLDVREG